MGTRWAGQGRATRRTPDSVTISERSAAYGREMTGYGLPGNAAIGRDGGQEKPNREISRFRRLRPVRPRLGTQYKVAFGVVFFGTFLISGGFFLGFAAELGSWGYVGAFVINLVSSATVVLPSPGVILIIQMVETLNWWILGIVTGIAGGLGGVTAYMAGMAGTNSIGQGRFGAWMKGLFESKWGPILLFSFNLIPFAPGDALSAIAGVIRYPLPRYFLYATVANIFKMLILTFVGAFASVWLIEQIEALLP